ncbi:hypothetical protein BT69DRAFT_8213 [Atractiella rhizophila]|nr:hypothetical protein BT69DRAFT_8213 [Atractiella rhizophila]
MGNTQSQEGKANVYGREIRHIRLVNIMPFPKAKPFSMPGNGPENIFGVMPSNEVETRATQRDEHRFNSMTARAKFPALTRAWERNRQEQNKRIEVTADSFFWSFLILLTFSIVEQKAVNNLFWNGIELVALFIMGAMCRLWGEHRTMFHNLFEAMMLERWSHREREEWTPALQDLIFFVFLCWSSPTIFTSCEDNKEWLRDLDISN